MMHISSAAILAVIAGGLTSGAAGGSNAGRVQVETVQPPPPIRTMPPPPPVVVAPPRDDGPPVTEWVMAQGLLVWQLDRLSCADGGNDTGLAAHVVSPIPTLERSQFPKDETAQRRRIARQSRYERVSFDIDASGRAVSIRGGGYKDMAAALAVSRFPTVARHGCLAAFVGQMSPMALAPVSDLLAYTVNAVSGPLPREGWARIAEGGNCMGDATPGSKPAPLRRGFPDFSRIAGRPGVREWSAIGYDTNAAGRPVHMHVRGGSGSPMLDAAAIKAVRASRFTGGARTGCTYPYWRQADAVAAPEMPDRQEFPSADGCPQDVILTEEQKAALSSRYPRDFARRRIEGWAIVGYDVAPWGQVGNVKVLAAQPASVFGDAASLIVTMAKVAPSPRGASGCVQNVRFRLDASRTDEDKADASNGLNDPMF